jgi:hypothetical protein
MIERVGSMRVEKRIASPNTQTSELQNNHKEIVMTVAVPKWFKPVVILALIWNLIGLLAWVVEFTVTPELIAQMSEAQQAIYEASPSWLWMATGVAVIAGTLGCVGLIMKRTWSTFILSLSMLGLIGQDLAIIALIHPVAPVGVDVMGMQSVVFVIGVALLCLSRKMNREGWSN